VPEPVNSDPPQLHYSLIKRAAEESILPPLQQHRITALAYSPLEAGVLARLSDSERTQASPRFAKSTTSMIDAALRETVIPIAPRHHATMPPCHHATTPHPHKSHLRGFCSALKSAQSWSEPAPPNRPSRMPRRLTSFSHLRSSAMSETPSRRCGLLTPEAPAPEPGGS
jgi:hypothetical protein